MPPTQPTGYVFEPASPNPDALFDELGNLEADAEADGEAMEVSSPYAGDDVEPSAVAMQTSAQVPGQPIGTGKKGELGMLRQFLLDASIPPDQIPGGRQQILNLLRHCMDDGPNKNTC
ncbi:hypothetical protein BWQ96_05904 [Gracilariopsis chorda]|uniref:Uncharacterized protein n=1 Tax=Gracilariopsis chorda TaxID=448386 RepID=A0A2V3IT98_9FLOR|nr:hypothetical protein BWQ96_05904 [Gracilariopsis chorda]|eukprot:PXF44340.1 hypothetical protein BWQ96_05904 [Gracilariopsis chorda]